ncbi:MAG: hypothetical protein Q4C53_05570 [Clostridia bacterium]|nr:hypothetical protein [Clostridia bacterium]
MAALQYGMDERGGDRAGQIYALSCLYRASGDFTGADAARNGGMLTIGEDALAAFFNSVSGLQFERAEEEASYDIAVTVAGYEYTFDNAGDPVSVTVISCEPNGDAVTVIADVAPGGDALPATVQLTAVPVGAALGWKLA